MNFILKANKYTVSKANKYTLSLEFVPEFEYAAIPSYFPYQNECVLSTYLIRIFSCVSAL